MRQIEEYRNMNVEGKWVYVVCTFFMLTTAGNGFDTILMTLELVWHT